MAMHNNLSEIEARCTEIINSPYMRRELPPELLKLRLLLNKVEKLTREDVPALVGEIKRLRSQNKRLEAEAEATHLASDSLDPIEVIEVIEAIEAIEEIEASDTTDTTEVAEVAEVAEATETAATDEVDETPAADEATKSEEAKSETATEATP